MNAVAGANEPIPRACLNWLLVAQALVIVPFALHIPLVLIGLWLGCTFWRIQIFRMRARAPSTWVKAALLLGTAAGVFLARGSLVGLEAGAALLIAAFVLKMLEMQSRRDALVLIFLGFFCVAVGYLFEDSLPWGLFTLAPICTLLAALIGLQQSDPGQRPVATFRQSAGLLLQAVPLMLVLFLFFPRLDPLWSLPQPSGKGLTGLSDSMAPADVTELGRSAALVFRASFKGTPPPRRDLYWRVLSFEQFDGRRWSQAGRAQLGLAPDWRRQGPALSYSVVMEPSGRPWLVTLDTGEAQADNARQMIDFRWQRRTPVDQAMMYSARSWPDAVREPVLDDGTRRQNLLLPTRGNPRAREWAQQLQRRHDRPDDLAEAVMAYFTEQPFRYTLKPGAAGPDSIDEFLFDSRLGFCAHYAGAMTFVLRAAGIPARVVAGYQGGELNPDGNYLTVRQFDAHAWVEYWQAGVGWRSIDPTAAVAPQRIEQGLEQALAADEPFLADSPMSALRYRNLPWLNGLRLQWDSLNYGWQRWVLGYQGQQQLQVLGRWFSGFDTPAFAGAVLLAIGLSCLWLFKPWRRDSDAQLRLFAAFERLLARHGLNRQAGEGARAFGERAKAGLPAHAEAIDRFVACFEAQRYAGQPVMNAELRRALRLLKRRLRRRAPGPPSPSR